MQAKEWQRESLPVLGRAINKAKTLSIFPTKIFRTASV